MMGTLAREDLSLTRLKFRMNHKFVRFSSADRDVPALRKTWVAGIVASASLPSKLNAHFNRGNRDSGEISTRWLLKIPLIQGSGDGGFLAIQRDLDWEKKLPKVLTAGQILIANYCSRNGLAALLKVKSSVIV